MEELKAAGCDIDWKVVNVNLATDMFTDWYMEVSPNSKMPAIRDDGFTMFESGAILHCSRQISGVLLPKDPHKKMDRTILVTLANGKRRTYVWKSIDIHTIFA